MQAYRSMNTEKVPPLRICESTGKNFGLTEKEFSEMLDLLVDGDNRLFERIFLEHFNESVDYLRRRDGARQEDAYDAVMSTLLQFRDLLLRRKIQYGNLRYLFTRMARQVYQKSLHRQAKFTHSENGPPDLIDETDQPFDEETHELLSRAFSSLGKDCRELLRAFYHRHQSLKELAKEAERSAPAVRKQKSRCIATLRDYFYRIS